MKTAAQKSRLIEAIAFIASHRKIWYQGTWVNVALTAKRNMCGTVGCLAGHVALTLNKSTPAITIPRELVVKPSNQLTEEEQVRVSEAQTWAAYVKATKADENAGFGAEESVVGGKFVRMIHVQYRARRLLGLDQWEADRLFDGTNTMTDIYDRAAYILGMSKADLKRQCKDVIAERGWDKPQRISA